MAALFTPFESNRAVGRCYDGVFTQVHSHTAADWMTPVRANRRRRGEQDRQRRKRDAEAARHQRLVTGVSATGVSGGLPDN